jgi:hypothetical protein
MPSTPRALRAEWCFSRASHLAMVHPMSRRTSCPGFTGHQKNVLESMGFKFGRQGLADLVDRPGANAGARDSSNSSFSERYPRRPFTVGSVIPLALVQDAIASMEVLCHCSAICIQN